MVLDAFPKLTSLIVVDNLIGEEPEDDIDERKMLHDLESDFRKIQKQMADFWCAADDIPYTDLAIGFLLQGKFYSSVGLGESMLTWAAELHSKKPG